ncbi:MAG TPA: class I tRNA ligase family protein, partial [Clostridiales bacterium]|nr:class I tRNA ligase family protein [Clostridiales bacterium]
KYIGKKLKFNTILGEKELMIIADKFVEPEFGTGAVKVTPAHDFNDFEMWERHKKEMPEPIKTIDEDGKMTNVAGPYKGMKIDEARAKIVQEMLNKGFIDKIDSNYTHSVSVCYKCKKTIEPLIKSQWFIKTKPIAKPAIDALKNGEVEIIPKSYSKVYFHWLKNIRDWNISRQNWWGIAIPAWQCLDCGHWTITTGSTPKKCEKCDSKNIQRDPDVFDTWFSSGQWPFAVFKKKDFKTFYPTSVMETGYDILFFWVIRMMMLSLYVTKKPPFKKIYLHGLVRDKDRQKMSKSKGNVIDPMEITEKYGTDALRLALIIGNMPGKDVVISEEKIKELEDSIEQWNLNKENIDKAYEPKVETFHVQAGKSHYAAFTVRGKTWSSRATADDVKSAKLIYNRGSYEIMINYDEYFYSELPLDMTTLEYGRMFDLPSCTALTKPSDTSFVFNALTLKNGLVRSKIDLDTGTLEDAKYFFEYIWDYSQIGKDSTTNEDTESRFVYTVKNTAEYVMGEGLPQ